MAHVRDTGCGNFTPILTLYVIAKSFLSKKIYAVNV